jgi:hypothetical protein
VSVQETYSMPDVSFVASEILEPIKGKLKQLLFFDLMFV